LEDFSLQSYKRSPALGFDRVTSVDPCDYRTTTMAAAITALLPGRLTILHTTQRLDQDTDSRSICVLLIIREDHARISALHHKPYYNLELRERKCFTRASWTSSFSSFCILSSSNVVWQQWLTRGDVRACMSYLFLGQAIVPQNGHASQRSMYTGIKTDTSHSPWHNHRYSGCLAQHKLHGVA
jgi:hypothetical protein